MAGSFVLGIGTDNPHPGTSDRYYLIPFAGSFC